MAPARNLPPHPLPPDVARPLAAFASAQDWPTSELLTAAGIDGEAVLGGRLGVTESQVVTVLRGLWEHTDDELLGCALRLAATFLPALPALSLRIGTDRRRACAWIEVPHHPSRPDDPDHVVLLCSLLVVHRLVTWAVGGAPPGARVEVPWPRTAASSPTEALFGAPVSHSAHRAALVVDLAALALPIVRGEEDVELLVAGAPRTLLHVATAIETTGSRVRRLLVGAVRDGDWPAADAVARQLAISPQTLRRRLQEEGTCFRGILEEVRHDAAVASLDLGRETVAQLASRLGYSEASAFARAFQRWTGSTPGVHRQRSDRTIGCRAGA